MSSATLAHGYTARARLFGGNRMKLGVMAFNCSHGSTITTVPEAWKLNWPDTKDIAQAVDRAGMEALLPVGRWKGYGGPSNFNNCTFESFTWASAIGAVTNYCTVLATVHVPLVHPLMVAKMAATIDHVTGGRFAMNVVCGWFKNEFDMFGAHMRPHDDRYKYATEWLDFVRRAWTQDDEFDFTSESFNATAVWSQPKPLQKPHPPIMNAGGSPAAQDFTTRYCDMNFVILKDRTHLEGAKAQIDHLKQMARSHGRETRIWIHVYVVCRESEKEAKDYLNYYVYEKGDWEAAGNLLKIFGLHNQTLDAKTLDGHKAHFIAGHVPPGLPAILAKFAALDVDVAITELDVRVNFPATRESFAQQAADYRFVVTACLNVARCVGITTWGISDAHSWIPDYFPGHGEALLFDRGGDPKPAYAAAIAALRR